MSEALDKFLSIASSHSSNNIPKRSLIDTDLFSKENDEESNTADNIKNVAAHKKPASTVHNGDTDSSDDEDNKYYEDRKYNECGKNIKHSLHPSSSTTELHQPAVTWKSKISNAKIDKGQTTQKVQGVGTDPIFGLRIVNPVVSFTTLQERMIGREAVMFSKIKTFVTGNISDKNWVLAGIIVGKSAVKTSQKGSQFLIWTLSDLKDDIKTVSVFLFGSAYKDLWKTATGAVVGVLNPAVLEKRDSSKDEALLSVDNAQKVMILGQSKDLGKCKSVKKNGEQCNSIVNVSRCEYCIYHIKQEYQKCSLRSELQSNFSGKGLTALRNKVLGKNEVFYAGRLYTAIPAKRSRKMEEKDDNRLQALHSNNRNATGMVKSKKCGRNNLKSAANIEVTQKQRLRDLTLLEKLTKSSIQTTFSAQHSAEATLETSKKTVADVLSKLRENSDKKSDSPRTSSTITETNSQSNLTAQQPVTLTNKSLLSNNDGVINLDVKISSKHIHRAKLNALKYIKKNGPLTKEDPNLVKKKSTENKKRILENSDIESPSKKQKIIQNEFLSDRFKKMMQTASTHTDLLEDRDMEEKDKYFHKLEVKEQMEEKMINTFKVPCKAVTCLTCKYTSFSSSQFCKDNKHPLKVFDTVKRFFKCRTCQNRTVSLDIVPTITCNNCGYAKWERTGMMKEKKAEVAHTLSIRGGEQKFVNSVTTGSNLDLLVPDE